MNLILLSAIFLSSLLTPLIADEPAETVTQTPGFVAFWDFVKREPNGHHRFTAHVPAGATTDYPLDAANYIKEYWGNWT